MTRVLLRIRQRCGDVNGIYVPIYVSFALRERYNINRNYGLIW